MSHEKIREDISKNTKAIKKTGLIKDLLATLKKHNFVVCGSINVYPAKAFEEIKVSIEETRWSGNCEELGGPYIEFSAELKEDNQELSAKEKQIYGKKVNGFVFKEFQNPIDGKVIASSQDLRSFESRYGVKQAGNDLIKPKNERIENDRKQKHSDSTGLIDLGG